MNLYPSAIKQLSSITFHTRPHLRFCDAVFCQFHHSKVAFAYSTVDVVKSYSYPTGTDGPARGRRFGATDRLVRWGHVCCHYYHCDDVTVVQMPLKQRQFRIKEGNLCGETGRCPLLLQQDTIGDGGKGPLCIQQVQCTGVKGMGRGAELMHGTGDVMKLVVEESTHNLH